MQSLEFSSTSEETHEASRAVVRSSRRRRSFKSAPLLTIAALLVSVVLWSVVAYRESQDSVESTSLTIGAGGVEEWEEQGQEQNENGVGVGGGVGGSSNVKRPTETETETEVDSKVPPEQANDNEINDKQDKEQQEQEQDQGGEGKDNNSCSQQPLDCQTDRMGHNTPLLAGQALCNHEYRFGVLEDGSAFVWQNCSAADADADATVDADADADADAIAIAIANANATQANGDESTVIFYSNADGDPNSIISYFQMTDTGTFQLFGHKNMDKNEIAQPLLLWEQKSTQDIQFSAQCLHKPQLDCPYLHLHKSGDVVLNSIDKDGKWNTRNIKRCFNDLF